MSNATTCRTAPAPAGQEAAFVRRIKPPSPLVLAAMAAGFSAAEAIAHVTARAAESARLAQLAVSL